MSTESPQTPLDKIARGFRACRDYVKAWRALKTLPRERERVEIRRLAACGEIGAAAVGAGEGMDLPAFEAVKTAREKAAEAGMSLAGRQSALQRAEEDLRHETEKHREIISRAQAEAKSASDTMAAAEREMLTALQRVEAMDNEKSQAKTKLTELGSTSDSLESDDAVKARLSDLEQRERELTTALALAGQRRREAAAAADASAAALQTAEKAWQSTWSKLQKALESAETGDGPDKEVAIQSARNQLTEETQRNEATLARLETEKRERTGVLATAAEECRILTDDLAKTQVPGLQARHILTSRELRKRLTELESQRPAAAAVAESTASVAATARKESEAQAEALRTAKTEQAEATTRAEAAVAAARSAQGEAGVAAKASQEALDVANRNFGGQVFAAGLSSGPLAEPVAKTAACVAEIAAIDETIARQRVQKEASFGPARLTVLMIAGVLAIVAITATVLIASSRTKPEKTALVDDGKNDDTPSGPLSKVASSDLCRQRLTRLGKAVKSYKLVYNKKPGKLSDLYKENFIARVEDFFCPASGLAPASEKEIDSKGDYTMDALPGAEGVVVREKTAHHENGKLIAVMEDGTLREF